MPDAGILELLALELADLRAELLDLATQPLGGEVLTEQCVGLLLRLSDAAEMLEIPILSALVDWYTEDIQMAAGESDELAVAAAIRIESSLQALQKACDEQTSDFTALWLNDLQEDTWSRALPAELLTGLAGLLSLDDDPDEASSIGEAILPDDEEISDGLAPEVLASLDKEDAHETVTEEPLGVSKSSITADDTVDLSSVLTESLVEEMADNSLALADEEEANEATKEEAGSMEEAMPAPDLVVAQIRLAHDPAVDPRLLEAFFLETPDQAVELAAVLSLSQEQLFQTDNLQSAQRLVHTIKGSAALVGYAPVEALAHAMEDVLEPLTVDPSLIDALPELTDLLQQGGDHLSALFEGIADDLAVDDPEALTRQFREIGYLLGGEDEVDSPAFTPAFDSQQAKTSDTGNEGGALDASALLWDESIDGELIDSFFIEVPLQMEALSDVWQGMPSNPLEACMEAERLAHTIKRSALTVGIQPVADHALMLESATEAGIRAGDQLDVAVLHPAVSDGIEFLHALFAAVEGVSEPPAGGSAVYQGLRTAIDAVDKLRSAPAVPSVKSEAVDDTTTFGLRDVAAQTLRVPTARIDQLMRLMGEMTTSLSQLQGQLSGALDRVSQVAGQAVITARRLGDLDEMVLQRGLLGSHGSEGLADARQASQEPAWHRPEMHAPRLNLLAENQASGADGVSFDPLEMDQYHELHGLVAAFSESLIDSRDLAQQAESELTGLSTLLHVQQRLSQDLSETVLATRMVSVDTLAPRLERAVRETARVTNKMVDIDIEGRDLLVDTDIVNGLRDPLMHIMRNAVDHGLEGSQQRIASFKPETGLISVRFARQGNRIQLTIRDDGRGFDTDAIRLRCQELGLQAPKGEWDEDALLKVLLRPGFSTRTEVSTTSGRGVGMDVVYQAVNELGGSIRLRNWQKDGELDNQKGSERGGAEILISLPVTLVAVPVLLVGANGSAGNQVVAIPADDIDQVLFLEAEDVRLMGDGMSYLHGDREYPLLRLNGLLGGVVSEALQLETIQARASEILGQTILLLGEEHGYQAVAIDQALERREIVAQPLGEWLPDIRGVSGACTLVDGRVAPILDMRGLLSEAIAGDELGVRLETHAQDLATDIDATNAYQPLVLVVDDSFSARLALELAVEQAGYRVASAIDGVDAIRAVSEQRPDLVLVDMEMPRMNGLELTSHLRGSDETRDLPIIMVTSRSTEKHRKQAEIAGVSEYITKPFAPDALVQRITHHARSALHPSSGIKPDTVH